MEEQIDNLATHIQKVLKEKGPQSTDSLHSLFVKTVFFEVNNRLYLFRITNNATVYVVAHEPLFKLDASHSYPIYDKDKITYVAFLQKGKEPESKDDDIFKKLKDVIPDIQAYLDDMKDDNE